MKNCWLAALVAFLAFAFPLAAQADVVWLLKEHAGLRITLEWTDMYGTRHKVTDGESASLEDGVFQGLHAEAVVTSPPGDPSEASYGIDYRCERRNHLLLGLVIQGVGHR
jgi:hypothetical protein